MYENPGSHPLEARTFGYKISYSPDVAKKAKAREIKRRKELRMFYIELIKYLNYKGVNREKDLKSQMKHLHPKTSHSNRDAYLFNTLLLVI